MPLPDDHFDQWFTNRASELEEWQNALDAPEGEPPASRVFIGVTGSGKTFLRRRFAQLAQAARVACVTVELADDKGGSQQVDPAVLAHRVAREMGIECPRTELALLRIAALESGSQVVEQQLAAELAADTLGSAFDALLEQFHSFSLGGVVATFLKHGYQKFKQGQQALQRYLKTEDGADDRSWVLGQKEPSDLRLDLFRRLAEDLAAGPPRKESAVQAVVLFDSGEHGGPELPVLDRLLDEVPGVLAVLFGQQDIESDVALHRVHLDGFERHDAEQYCTEKRGVPAVQVEGILSEAHEEGGRYHVYSLGLLCDAALDGKGPLAVHRLDRRKSRPKALSKRFLARLSEEDQGFLRRLALLPDFDEDAACHACATGSDAERRGAKMRWLQGFSFVQPAGEGRWRLHAVMRRVLAEDSGPVDNLRRHREWAEYWQGRSGQPTDEAAARAWYHQFALGLIEAMENWNRAAEEALRNARTAEHAWLVDVARPLVFGAILGGAVASREDRAAAMIDWANQSQEAVIGDIRARLEEAVGAYRTALKVYTREDFPAGWAAAQNNLGNALRALGEREEDTERLEEAARAYRAALEVFTREAFPADWATTQNNLGTALGSLGQREEDSARLEEAVAAFRAALEVRTRGAFPADWAGIQNNLGSALQTLGEREEDTERLEEAVRAYRAALEVYTREAFPAHWATTQNNLGTALRALGEREEDTERLEEAVAAYRAALEVRTRAAFPAGWATTQNNLGNALRALGEREEGTARLEEAVEAFGAALEVRTREAFPADWAMTQNNLGAALQALGEREEGTARLEEAAAAFRAALGVSTREAFPAQWAMTQNNLGNALRALGEREEGTARLREAVAAFRAALEVYTREAFPAQWATTQNNLGNALRALGELLRDAARLREAVAAFRAALGVSTREAFPAQWAMTQNNLGNALRALGEREGDAKLLDEAAAAFRAALKVYTREAFPAQWASAQNNLGNALRALGEGTGDTVLLEEAVAAYRAALEVRTREAFPAQWATTQNNLGTALRALGGREEGTGRLEEAVAAYRAALEVWTEANFPHYHAIASRNLVRALALLAERGG